MWEADEYRYPGHQTWSAITSSLMWCCSSQWNTQFILCLSSFWTKLYGGQRVCHNIIINVVRLVVKSVGLYVWQTCCQVSIFINVDRLTLKSVGLYQYWHTTVKSVDLYQCSTHCQVSTPLCLTNLLSSQYIYQCRQTHCQVSRPLSMLTDSLSSQ